MKTVKELAQAFGSQRIMSEAVGETRGCVEQWCQRNRIPAGKVEKVARRAKVRGIKIDAAGVLRLMRKTNAA